MGLASLVARNGTPAVVVGNVDGVRGRGAAAGGGGRLTLLQWGDGSYAGNSNSPSFFHDVFIRVGGPDSTPVQASTMMLVQSGHVVGDNAWLWRADHTATGPVSGGANPCATGLKVSGDDVTMYGLAVEHTLQDLTVWTGERGAVYFYQSELPYDVDQKYGDSGYAGYRVGDGVASHDAWGVGVYHFFRDNEVTVPSGIVVPEGLVDRINSPLSVYLSRGDDGTHHQRQGQLDVLEGRRRRRPVLLWSVSERSVRVIVSTVSFTPDDYDATSDGTHDTRARGTFAAHRTSEAAVVSGTQPRPPRQPQRGRTPALLSPS